jgi:hypothetical protein
MCEWLRFDNIHNPPTEHAMTFAITRRQLVYSAAASMAIGSVPRLYAQEAARHFEPKPAGWRRFEVTTTVQLRGERGDATIWLPVPSVDTSWQRTTDSSWSGTTGDIKLASDGRTGAQVLVAKYAAGTTDPTLVLTNVVETQNRAVDWSAKEPAADPSDLHH